MPARMGMCDLCLTCAVFFPYFCHAIRMVASHAAGPGSLGLIHAVANLYPGGPGGSEKELEMIPRRRLAEE